MASYDMDRKFGGGATRDTEQGKPDYEGFLSPRVLERYGQYMHKHRSRPDGSYRDSDNWQLGIPLDAYMKSGWRHFVDWWKEHRKIATKDGIEEALCALIFNASGYLHEHLKAKASKKEAEVGRIIPVKNIEDYINGRESVAPTYSLAQADGYSGTDSPNPSKD